MSDGFVNQPKEKMKNNKNRRTRFERIIKNVICNEKYFNKLHNIRFICLMVMRF